MGLGAGSETCGTDGIHWTDDAGSVARDGVLGGGVGAVVRRPMRLGFCAPERFLSTALADASIGHHSLWRRLSHALPSPLCALRVVHLDRDQ